MKNINYKNICVSTVHATKVDPHLPLHLHKSDFLPNLSLYLKLLQVYAQEDLRASSYTPGNLLNSFCTEAEVHAENIGY